MEYRLQPTAKGAPPVLVLSGQLSVQHAPALQQLLLEQLAAGKGLHLLLREVEELDLAGVQLLLALEKSLKATSQPYHLQLELSIMSTALLNAAGLLSHLNQTLSCHGEVHTNCR